MPPLQALKQCRDALAAMESEKSDYMIRNKLGNPAGETTNRMARAALTAADTALAALSEPQDERAAFEAWIWKDSTLSVNRSGGGYDNMSTALLWSAWQARASLAPAQQPALAQQVPEPQPEYNTPVFDEAAYKRDVSAQAAQWAAQQVPAVPEPPTLADVLDALNVFNPPSAQDRDNGAEPWAADQFMAVTALPAFIHNVGRAWYAAPLPTPTPPREMTACPHDVPHRWACDICDSATPEKPA